MPATVADLIAAIRADDVEALALALKDGADPNGQDLYGMTPLAECAYYCNVDALRALIDAGMRIEGSKMLFGMIEPDITDKMRLLIEHGLDPKERLEDGSTTLISFMEMQPWNVAVVDLLLEHGVDPNAITTNHVTALMCLADGGAQGELQVAHSLIDAGADVNQVDPSMGWSVLMRATDGEGRPRLVELLCEAGADPDVASTWGETPLMRALRDHSVAKAKVLLRFTKHLDAVDQRGVSVLDLAEGLEKDVGELLTGIRAANKPAPTEERPESADEQPGPIAGP